MCIEFRIFISNDFWVIYNTNDIVGSILEN